MKNRILIPLLAAGVGLTGTASAESLRTEESLRSAAVLMQQGRYREAVEAYRTTLGALERPPQQGDRVVTVLGNLGAALYYTGQYRESEAVIIAHWACWNPCLLNPGKICCRCFTIWRRCTAGPASIGRPRRSRSGWSGCPKR